MAEQTDNKTTTKGNPLPVRKYRYVGPEYNLGIIVGSERFRPKEFTDKQIKELEATQPDLFRDWFVAN